MHPEKLRILLIVLLLITSNAALAAPAIKFSDTSTKVIEIPPGSAVVLWGTGRQPDGYESTIFRWAEILSDDDRDGTVSLDLGQPVPWKSVWVAAQLPSAQFTIASPDGFHASQVPLPPNAFRSSRGELVDLFANNHPFVDLLYIHPSGDAFVARAANSYDSDADGRNDGITSISIDQLTALSSNSHRPKEFAPGGVLFSIDRTTLEISAVRLDAKSLAGGASED